MGEEIMKFKKIMLLAIFLVSLLAVSAVSAADNATSDVVSVEETDITNIEMTDEIDLENDDLTADDENEVLSTNPKTFSDLNTTINGNDYSDVYLNDNFTFDLGSDGDFKDGVEIKRDLTLWGNGHTINGDLNARIFKINNVNVIFKDIIFTNAKTLSNGGAIFGKCVVINCTFVGNTANYGGALYGGYAYNSSFINNSAKLYSSQAFSGGYGGSIYNGYAQNCTFIDNYGYYSAGGIMNSNADNCTFINNYGSGGGAMRGGTATNCIFIGNNGWTNYGGATYEVNAVNCTFRDNSILYGGGAMYRGSATNCTFINNIVSNYDGGALYECNAIGCTFIDNHANSDGGAMYRGSATNCTFTNNKANDNGGAMFGDGYVATNCQFTNNTAKNGGATYQITAINCNFTGNNATVDGGAIFGGSCSNSKFNNNHANSNGGASYNSIISNSIFEFNSANNGGAMYEGKITNGIFNYNRAENCGGAVCNGTVSLTSKFNNNVARVGDDTYNTIFFVVNKNFNDLNILINGNSSDNIYLNDNFTFDLGSDGDFKDGVEIKRDLTLWGNGHTINGDLNARIFKINNVNVIFKDIIFTNAKTLSNGGAIFGKCVVINCTFVGNTANYGGALYGGYAYNSSFINNSAKLYSSQAFSGGYGGSIYNGYAQNCTFIDNYGYYSAGGIMNSNADNCTFINNYGSGGGAMRGGTATNCIFIGNNGWTNYGGATYEVNAVNCTFRDNSILYGGGAMYRGSATNCTFINNIVSNYDGGALYECNAIGCTFIDNHANSDGGAMYRGSATNCTFTNNKANDNGGAMFGDGYVATNCQFTNNTAKNGGATYQITAINCNFTDDSVAEYGGAMYEGIAVDCNFTNCVAGMDGDSTYNTAMPKTTLSVNNFTARYGENKRFGVNLTSWSGEALNNINITIKIYENNYLVGTYSCLSGSGWIVDLDGGNYTAVVSVKNNAYKADPVNASIIITKMPVNLNISQIGNYFNSSYALINVTDKEGLGLSNVNVSVSFEGINANLTTNSSGSVLYKLPEFSGNFNVTVKVTSKSHEAEAINQIFTLDKLPVKLAVEQIGTYFDSSYVNVKVTDLDNIALNNVNITISINDSQVDLSTNGSGVVLYKLPELAGTYNVTVNVTSQKFIPYCVNKLFVLNKYPANISVSQLGTQLNSTFVKVNVTYGGMGLDGIDVTIYLGEEYGSVNLKTNSSGCVIYKMPNTIGTYNVVVGINSSSYESDPVKQSIFVGKIPVNLTLTQIGEYYDSSYLFISLKDLNGVNLIGVNVNLLIDDKKINLTTDENGSALYQMPNVSGNYNVTVFINSTNLEADSINKIITISKYPTIISVGSVTTTYNTNKDLVITLKDSKGIALSGATVIVDLNGAKTYTTDKNGQIIINVGKMLPKTYTAKITFNGNNNYNLSSASVKVTVKKAKAKITAKKKTFKRKVKTKKYTITLKNNVGKAIKKAKVIIKINKKTYTAKTNAKGKATFKIKKLTKKGKYKATVTYKGNNCYNKVTKKVKITVK